MIETALSLFRVILYGWAFYEIGSLSFIYFLSYGYTKKKGILGLAFLFTSAIGFIILLIFANIFRQYIPEDIAIWLINLLIIPVIGLALSARYIRSIFSQHNGH